MDELKIAFTRNKKKITISEIDPCYKTEGYFVYKTNIPKYYIKIYASEDFTSNKNFANLFHNTTSILNSQSNNVVKIYDIKEQEPLVALLIDSYELILQELIYKGYFATNFDIFKFLFQMCKNIHQLNLCNINGFYLGLDNIIIDNNLNYKITHFDRNLNQRTENEVAGAIKIISKDLAPEYFVTHEYNNKSNIWDLGMLLHKILFNEFPRVDYSNQKIDLNVNISEIHEELRFIIETCLEWDHEKRPNAEKIMGIIIAELLLIEEFTSSSNITQELKDEFAIILSFKTFNNDNSLFDFAADSLDLRTKHKMSSSEILNYLLQENFTINNELLQMLIKNGWSDANSHIACYYRMISVVQSSINNRIIIMKVLLMLHAYMHRSSHKCLLAVNIQNKNRNLLDDIFDPILININTTGDLLIGSYTLLLQRKYKFALKYIKLIENNFSIPKIDIIVKWQKLIKPRILLDICEYMQFAFCIFLRIKDFYPNYFVKNMLLFVSKEVISIMGLFINLIVLLKYVVDFNSSISSDDKKIIDDFIDNAVDLCENYRKIIDEFMMEMQKPEYDFGIAKLFITDKNLKEAFLFLCKQMSARKTSRLTKTGQKMFNIKDYTRYYIGYVLRMPEPLGSANNGSLNKLDRYADVSQELNIICDEYITYLKSHSISPPNILKYIKAVFIKNEDEICPDPDTKKLITANTIAKQEILFKKPETNNSQKNKANNSDSEAKFNSVTNNKLDETEQHNPNDSKDDTITEKNPNNQTYIMNFVEGKKRMIDVAIQNELLQEEKATEELCSELQNSVSNTDDDNDATGTNDNNVDANGKEGLTKSGLSVSNFNLQNMETFLLTKFSRSVEEWIIDFNEIEFGKLIATGSTCQVYRGFYKSLPVAIKKLLRPENEKKIKFLKEFKREIALLVSLPAHPSLLTLIGFCITDGVVHLLTEFCDGGTLFDILYRKSLGFKLS